MRLNTIFNLVITAILLFVGSALIFNERSKRITAERNLTATIKDKSLQVEVTKRTADRLYGATIDSLSREIGIKPKQIVQWMKGEIEYRDTGSVVVIPPRIDTVKVYPDSLTGRIDEPCFTLDILLYKNKFHHEFTYKDELMPVIFRERPKQFLFIKYGKWQYRAEIISKCMDSSLRVYENVRITGR